MALGFGHHILCRAKSNAVFYRLPKHPKRPKRGRPRKYGDRLDIRRLRYNEVDIDGRSYSITSKVVRNIKVSFQDDTPLPFDKAA